jgi:hypothetical protein
LSGPLPSFVFGDLPAALPSGYRCVALTPEQQGGVARLGAVVQDAKPNLIVLREMLDARVILGAIFDAAGRVHEFVEIWSQDTRGLAAALPTYRQNLGNRLLDERWRARAKALDDAAGAGRYTTGWEEAHPEPIFLDLKKGVPVRAVEKSSGGPWALCEDDEFLKRKGKEPFAASLSRYLYAPMQGDRSPLIAIAGPEAHDEAAIVSDLGLASGGGGGGGVVPVSLGGLMMVLPLAPLSFEQFVDALGGAGGEGSTESMLRARAARPTQNGEIGRSSSILASGAGWLGASSASPGRRLPEVLHLKLRLLAEAVGIVRALSQEGPLLNVSADSFRVHLARGGSAAAGLPMWWTGRVGLASPGEAIPLTIPGSQVPYFLAGSDRLSIYSAATLGASTQGRGVVRIRRVVDASTGSSGGSPPDRAGLAFGTMFECTLTTQERLSVGANDLVWLRFTIGGTRVDTYAVADSRSGAGGGGGELRLRTLAQELPPGAAERLTQGAGVPIPDAMFEVLPLLSTPSDLYSLGVLAVRTLLVNEDTSLPVALDEAMSLANVLATEKPPEPGADAVQAASAAIGRILAAQKRYLDALGCQRLVSEKVDPAVAAAMIPAALWHEVLAVIFRMFPAAGWFSRCKDFGDAPAGAPHRVYDGILDSLHTLLTKTRSLIVADQGLSREVHQVVKELLVRG